MLFFGHMCVWRLVRFRTPRRCIRAGVLSTFRPVSTSLSEVIRNQTRYCVFTFSKGNIPFFCVSRAPCIIGPRAVVRKKIITFHTLHEIAERRNTQNAAGLVRKWPENANRRHGSLSKNIHIELPAFEDFYTRTETTNAITFCYFFQIFTTRNYLTLFMVDFFAW